MAIYTYEDVIPTLISNTLMQKRYIDGVHKVYRITPIDGYVLHDSCYDNFEVDGITGMPTAELVLGYTGGTVTVAACYDFVENPRGLYATERTNVPEERIFDGRTK